MKLLAMFCLLIASPLSWATDECGPALSGIRAEVRIIPVGDVPFDLSAWTFEDFGLTFEWTGTELRVIDPGHSELMKRIRRARYLREEGRFALEIDLAVGQQTHVNEGQNPKGE